MLKSTAIKLLGGTPAEAARQVGVSVSAVSQWPPELPRRIEDRVLAVLARKHLPPDVLDGTRDAGSPEAPPPQAQHGDGLALVGAAVTGSASAAHA